MTKQYEQGWILCALCGTRIPEGKLIHRIVVHSGATEKQLVCADQEWCLKHRKGEA